MTSRHKLALVIPCYNEEACIGDVIRSIETVLPEAFMVIVNDCSADRTEEIVREKSKTDPRIVLLNLPINMGIGSAVQTGLRYAARNGFDYAVKVDGDGQHPVEQIGALLAPLEQDRADMTVGSRFLEKQGFQSTFCRRLGIGFFMLLNSALVGHRITDNTSGFRAYNRAALEFASEHYPNFDYPEPEEIVLMAKNRFRIAEVPTRMRCRQGGRSSISPAKSFYYMFKVFFAVLMAAVRPAARK